MEYEDVVDPSKGTKRRSLFEIEENLETPDFTNMEHDEAALPKLNRRISLFEEKEEEIPRTESTTKMKHDDDEEARALVPAECEVSYPVEYTDKVRTEIEEWKMHITKILDEQLKFRNEREKLERTVVDESILTPEQQDFFKSLNFDEYLERAENFCDRVRILVEKMQYKPEADNLERKVLAVQRKLEKDIFEKHFK